MAPTKKEGRKQRSALSDVVTVSIILEHDFCKERRYAFAETMEYDGMLDVEPGRLD